MRFLQPKGWITYHKNVLDARELCETARPLSLFYLPLSIIAFIDENLVSRTPAARMLWLNQDEPVPQRR